ncbi:MAG TPA: hypothetical protein VH916_11055 [Dehalococcoidia bacterium]|jgi:hypothetical protein
MEPEFGLDLQEVRRVIDTAEVVIVRFRILEPRLLIDARSNGTDGPLIQLVPKAQSVEERFHHLKELRPRFPLPDKILSFEWPKHITTLRDSGVWERVEERLGSVGGGAARERARGVLNELLAAERREEVAAIRGGDGYQTLWERPR